MYTVFYGIKFKKDYKLVKKRGYDIKKFTELIDILRSGDAIPQKYKDHALSGSYAGYRECHIEPDWLLIYKKENDILVLILFRTGSHSDLF